MISSNQGFFFSFFRRGGKKLKIRRRLRQAFLFLLLFFEMGELFEGEKKFQNFYEGDFSPLRGEKNTGSNIYSHIMTPLFLCLSRTWSATCRFHMIIRILTFRISSYISKWFWSRKPRNVPPVNAWYKTTETRVGNNSMVFFERSITQAIIGYLTVPLDSSNVYSPYYDPLSQWLSRNLIGYLSVSQDTSKFGISDCKSKCWFWISTRIRKCCFV